MDPQSVFADAVARARQLAAKINQRGQGSGDGINSGKRPIDDSNNFVSGGYPGLDHEGNSEAAQAAAQAAARINQQLGKAPNKQMFSPQDSPMGGMGMGMVIAEEYRVPDRMVGLIIGKGGEQIKRLQAETSCRIQIAPDSDGQPQRSTTLTGTPQAINKVKQEIAKIIDRASGGGQMDMGGFGEGGGGMGGGGGMSNLDVSFK